MPKGPKGQKRPADMNQLAKAIADIATGEQADTADPHGRAGGVHGGKTRTRKLTPEQRSEIARLAAAARWKKR